MTDIFNRWKSKFSPYWLEIVLSGLIGLRVSYLYKEIITPILFFGKGFEGRNVLLQIAITGGYAIFLAILGFLCILLIEFLYLRWGHRLIKGMMKKSPYRWEICLSILSGSVISSIFQEYLTPFLFSGIIFRNCDLITKILLITLYVFVFSIFSFLLIFLLERLFSYWGTQRVIKKEDSEQVQKDTQVSLFVSIGFLILVPAIAHFLFSSLGFNPTDDGFTLAYSRRILEGQIPHRDFIIIRPFLSPLLHVPIVWLGGDYTYLLSRLFVWFQFAFISWSWVLLLERKFCSQPLKNWERVTFALVSFAVSVHIFPIMVWHTVDGLFFITIGCILSLTENPSKKFAGYLIISLSYLCKQSFIFVAPLILILLGDWNKKRLWLAIVTPGILYLFFLLVTNALPDAFIQLLSQKEGFGAAIQAYFNWEFFLGLIVGWISTYCLIGPEPANTRISKDSKEWVGLLMLSLIPLIYLSMAFLSGFRFISSFYIFGLAFGLTAYLVFNRLKQNMSQIRAGSVVLIIAWSASLSIGYKYPILAAGPLLTLLFVFCHPFLKKKLEGLSDKPVYSAALICFSLIALLSFGNARFHEVYRDRRLPFLIYDLSSVLPGGNGIRTSENTYIFLSELQEVIKKAQTLGKTYTIVPDCPGLWVKSKQVNPISIDWPQQIELDSKELETRVEKELESIRQSNIVIVQKVEATNLSYEFTPLENKYGVVRYVRDNYSLVYETTLFELYK